MVMSLDSAGFFALLPAVYRTRDAANGGPLQALLNVLATQSAIVEDNIEQLYDDQFIETCTQWVIPYIGDLIGYNSIYQTSVGVDSRAEVANTIGYRRRKGTPIAMQQVAMDVAGRPAVVVEEFRRIITTQSMRLPRPHHVECIDLRRNAILDDLGDTAFDMSNRTLDVRRIAPRIRVVADPDAAPLSPCTDPDASTFRTSHCTYGGASRGRSIRRPRSSSTRAASSSIRSASTFRSSRGRPSALRSAA
jgi:hypothetical protein